MTYSIFDLGSGDLVDSFENEHDAAVLMRSMLDREPRVQESLAVVIADDSGSIVHTVEGEGLVDLASAAA